MGNDRIPAPENHQLFAFKRVDRKIKPVFEPGGDFQYFLVCRRSSRLFGHKDVTVILYLFHSVTGELGISSSQKGQMTGGNIEGQKKEIFRPVCRQDAASVAC